MRLLIISVALLFACSPSLAQRKVTRKPSGIYKIQRYKAPAPVKHLGIKHTKPHHGRYEGSLGSSHRGGKYKNPYTGNKYGNHKSKRLIR